MRVSSAWASSGLPCRWASLFRAAPRGFSTLACATGGPRRGADLGSARACAASTARRRLAEALLDIALLGVSPLGVSLLGVSLLGVSLLGVSLFATLATSTFAASLLA